jgi:hypothetical protein
MSSSTRKYIIIVPFLFIYGLLNNAFNPLGYLALNDVKRSGHGLICGTTPAFVEGIKSTNTEKNKHCNYMKNL